MTITFYLLLLWLNLTNRRKKFDWQRLEQKVGAFFNIYMMLWLAVTALTIFFYFVSIPVFIIFATVFVWFLLELFVKKTILVYGKNKEILQKEFMSVNKASVDQAIKEAKKNKHHK